MQDSTKYTALIIPVHFQLPLTQKVYSSSSIEKLLQFVLAKPDRSNRSNSNNLRQLKNEESIVLDNGEKYLSKWSVNMKRIKSTNGKLTVHLAITGNLLSDYRGTIIDEFYDAGLLIRREENDLIVTTNGVYRLVGNIIFGSPDGFYNMCLHVGGIPWAWRQIVDCLSKTNKRNKKKSTINFTLKSPAGPPIKTRKYVLKDQNSNKETMKVDGEGTHKRTRFGRAIRKPSKPNLRL
ncbi:Hypothetical protein CINCED_3A016693 [Cinara cedri]|uniref:Uncharacterized protein n=1 Tax=Cinara cedri TaxID=506608 RepID=A0A5E4NKN8_9HEMI|nr:Hypothetical protein CINCED_3A016693 [Cinara cedri]